MSNQMNTGSRGVRLVVVAYIVAVGVACFIISFASMVLIDTTKCGAVSRALPVLWGTIAVVFIGSGVVVRNIAWKVISDESVRLAVVVVYGVVMLASYIFIALVLLVALNC